MFLTRFLTRNRTKNLWSVTLFVEYITLVSNDPLWRHLASLHVAVQADRSLRWTHRLFYWFCHGRRITYYFSFLNTRLAPVLKTVFFF